LTGLAIDAVAVDPQQASTIYAASWTRFFKSEDGGLTWRSGQWGTPALFVRAIAIDPQNPSTIYAGAPSQGDLFFLGGVFRSTDGGTSWTATSLRCSVEMLAFDSQNSNTLYAGTDCGLYKTTDAGESWIPLYTAGGPTYVLAIDPLNSDTIFTNGSSGQIYKSADGGMNWIVATSGLPDGGYVSALLVDPASPNILYAQSSHRDPNKTGLFKSTDAAASWKRIGYGCCLLALDPQSAVYLAMPGGLLRSTDRGKSWSDVSAGLTQLPGRLAFDVAHPNTVHAATSAGVFVITLDSHCFMDSC
jgi:photosystem II stability/assembly factor-like uncharacterized protein